MPTIDWNRSWARNLIHHMKGGLGEGHYGDQWGDPESRPDLVAVRRRFLEPFIDPDRVALEIGSGGGRWTRYLLAFREVICVELNPEMFGYLKDRFADPPHLQYVTTHGWDIPFVPENHVDFAFTFGVFVHLDLEIISGYVQSVRHVLRPGGRFVLQFSNKRKPEAAANPDFSDNDPDRMTALLESAGFAIADLDDETMSHSTIISATAGS